MPANAGDKDGVPVAAEKLFDQMEIYPGVFPLRQITHKMKSNVKQDPRRNISTSYTKRQEYRTLKWLAWRVSFSVSGSDHSLVAFLR